MEEEALIVVVAPPQEDADLLSERIAKCALDHYHKGLRGERGKPKPNEEWTVYAAIVAHRRCHPQQGKNKNDGNNDDDTQQGKNENNDDDALWVVSCATGTKCTAQRQNGFIVHDAHAEVLARRGLMRVLWKEIAERRQCQVALDGCKHSQQLSDASSLLVESKAVPSSGAQAASLPEHSSTTYQLHPQIQLHLYVSDSPCGDASIYSISHLGKEVSLDETSQPSEEVQYTGAKILVSPETGVTAGDCGGSHQVLSTTSLQLDGNAIGTTDKAGVLAIVVAREESQLLGKLRTKAGRSNLPDHMRSTSMSCSDKIALWGTVGLQGGLLSHFLEPPVIPLTSVVVSRDPRASTTHGGKSWCQLAALERAISLRTKHAQTLVQCRLKRKNGCYLCPTVHLASSVFMSGKAAMRDFDHDVPRAKSNRKRKRQQESGRGDVDPKSIKVLSPCGIALNWNQFDYDMELLVGARGINQGKRPKLQEDYEKLSSRLSRAIFGKQLTRLLPNSVLTCTNSGHSYQHLKRTLAKEYKELKSFLFSEKGSPFSGWALGDEHF